MITDQDLLDVYLHKKYVGANSYSIGTAIQFLKDEIKREQESIKGCENRIAFAKELIARYSLLKKEGE